MFVYRSLKLILQTNTPKMFSEFLMNLIITSKYGKTINRFGYHKLRIQKDWDSFFPDAPEPDRVVHFEDIQKHQYKVRDTSVYILSSTFEVSDTKTEGGAILFSTDSPRAKMKAVFSTIVTPQIKLVVQFT